MGKCLVTIFRTLSMMEACLHNCHTWVITKLLENDWCTQEMVNACNNLENIINSRKHDIKQVPNQIDQIYLF